MEELKYYKKIYDELQQYPLTIIFGAVGTGKTSLLTFFSVIKILCGRKKYLKCCEQIAILNSQGYNFSCPPSEHTLASNFNIKSVCKFSTGKESYPLNPFRLSLPTEAFSYSLFPSHFDFSITESQAHLNARKSHSFRHEVSRLYENCRHNFWNIILDAQRMDLLDLNVRSIANRFIKVLDMQIKYDSMGRVVKVIWRSIEFFSYSDCEKFVNSGVLQNATKRKYVFYGDIFKCYNSYENQSAFYAGIDKQKDFDFKAWSEVDASFLKVPENYYEGKK